MRIVFISREHSAGEQGGGIGTYTTTAAQALAERGHEVAVVTRGPRAHFTEDGVEVVRIDHSTIAVPGLTRVRSSLRTSRALARLRPDVVQAAEWDAEAWWPARFSSTPVLTRLATPSYLAEALNRGQPDPANHVLHRLERDQTRRSARVLAPSRAIAARVAGDWGLDEEEIAVVPNPVDVDEVRRAAAAEPPIDLPGRYLAFIGRLEGRKGVHALAEALPDVLDRHPDLSAVFVGRDADAGATTGAEVLAPLVARFGERVRLVGGLPRAAGLAVLARAEIAALPSVWEAFGFVAAEALALGVPTVVGGGSGMAEVVEDGRSGWVVPPGDPAALRDTLLARLADPEDLRAIGDDARRRAEEFRPAEIARRLEAIYEGVLAERSGHGFDASIYVRDYRRHFRPEDEQGPFHRLYEQKLATVLEQFAQLAPRRVLDAGGGPGRLSAPLAARHEVTLCDISSEMLTEAAERCPEGVRFVEADARELPFGDGEFDELVALDLLCHLPDAEEGLRELARVVKPGGSLTFDTTNAAPWWVLAYPSYVNWRPARLLATLRSRGVLPEWRRTVRHHRRAEVERAASQAGLELSPAEPFGPPWSAKWHLWHAVKPAP